MSITETEMTKSYKPLDEKFGKNLFQLNNLDLVSSLIEEVERWR